jgi:salicylate hydroxylase
LISTARILKANQFSKRSIRRLYRPRDVIILRRAGDTAQSWHGKIMSLIGQTVIVIGAGIAGLACARALAMRGAGVTVLEQAPVIAEVGAGLQISPNGAAVLRALGLGAALDAAGLANQAVSLHNAQGTRLLRMDMQGRDYRLLHRADLIAFLAEAAVSAGVTLRLNASVAAVMPRQVTLATGETLAAPLVIGADGVKSQVRQALNGRVAPFFTRQVAWRALIPGDGSPAEAQVFMAPGRHLVTYPLRNGTLRNIVAVEERGNWAAEGWNHKDDPANLRAAFGGFKGPVPEWLAQVSETHLWGLFRHPIAKRMAADGMALIGDAAHPTLPFLAQGANMALEDAWVLADALANHDITTALAAYTAMRTPRVTRIVEAANANSRLYHAKGLRRLAFHTALRAANLIAPRLPLSRFDWLYAHDVTGQP